MMKLVALCEGGVKCSSACPHYAPRGVVEGRGGPLKTHCGQVMEPIIADCDLYNPRLTEFVDGVEPKQWKQILKALGLKSQKVRRKYDPEHKEIHPVGWRPQPGGCPKAKKKNRQQSNKPVKND